MRVGLVGPNGSGKTKLLRLMRGDIEPSRGKIKRADSLRVVYFDSHANSIRNYIATGPRAG